MDDDETGEVVKRTDLSSQVPAERATLRYQLEKTTVKVGERSVEVSNESYPGSRVNKAVAVLCLAAAVGVITGFAAISLPPVFALVIGIGTVVGLYLIVHFLPGHQAK